MQDNQETMEGSEEKACAIARSHKSTILYRITMGAVVASAPTVGSNHEIYEYKGVRFGLIDLGGQSSLRATWNQYFADTAAIILVIDSNDPARLALAKAELQKLVKAEVSGGVMGSGKSARDGASEVECEHYGHAQVAPMTAGPSPITLMAPIRDVLTCRNCALPSYSSLPTSRTSRPPRAASRPRRCRKGLASRTSANASGKLWAARR